MIHGNRILRSKDFIAESVFLLAGYILSNQSDYTLNFIQFWILYMIEQPVDVVRIYPSEQTGFVSGSPK